MNKRSRAGQYKSRDERMLDIIGAVYHHSRVEGYNGITPHAVAKKLGIKNIHHIRKLCYTLCDASMLAYVEAARPNGQPVIYLYPRSLQTYREIAEPTYRFLITRYGRQLPLPAPVGQSDEARELERNEQG